jgi:hypothetical protein
MNGSMNQSGALQISSFGTLGRVRAHADVYYRISFSLPFQKKSLWRFTKVELLGTLIITIRARFVGGLVVLLVGWWRVKLFQSIA